MISKNLIIDIRKTSYLLLSKIRFLDIRKKELFWKFESLILKKSETFFPDLISRSKFFDFRKSFYLSQIRDRILEVEKRFLRSRIICWNEELSFWIRIGIIDINNSFLYIRKYLKILKRRLINIFNWSNFRENGIVNVVQ